MQSYMIAALPDYIQLKFVLSGPVLEIVLSLDSQTKIFSTNFIKIYLPLSSLRPSCPNLLRPHPKMAPERVSTKL